MSDTTGYIVIAVLAIVIFAARKITTLSSTAEYILGFAVNGLGVLSTILYMSTGEAFFGDASIILVFLAMICYHANFTWYTADDGETKRGKWIWKGLIGGLIAAVVASMLLDNNGAWLFLGIQAGVAIFYLRSYLRERD